MDFGVLLVNDECLRELVLVNNSDSDIYYELLYVHYPSTLKEENSAAPAGMTVKPLMSDVKADLLVVDKPKGVLPARSKAKTTVSERDDWSYTLKAVSGLTRPYRLLCVV